MKESNVLKVNNKGMTMVEVLMGFAILSIILGGVITIIKFSSNMYFRSADMRREQATLNKMAYDDSTDGKTDITGELRLKHVEEGNLTGDITLEDGTAVQMNDTKVYQVSTGEGDDALRAYVYVSTITPTPKATPTPATP